MTTTINVTPSSNVTPANSGPGFTIGGGQAGLLYMLADEIIRTLNKLQKIAAELANAQTEVEKMTIKTGADATRDAAYKQSLATWMQAGASLLSGVASITATAAQPLATRGLNDKVAKVEEEAAPLKALKESALKPASTEIEMSNFAGNDTKTQQLNNRIAELKNGNYTSQSAPNDAALDKAAITSMKLDSMKLDNGKSYAKFRDKLDAQIETKSKESSSLQSQISERKQDINLYRDIATNGGGSVFKGAESLQSSEGGKSQAAGQVAGAIERMSDSSANAARGNLNQDYSKIGDVIAAARQGAQAYAQG